MKVCTRCGSQYEDTSTICSKCGILLFKRDIFSPLVNIANTYSNNDINSPTELRIEEYALSTDLFVSENVRKIPVLTKATEKLISMWSKPMEKAKILGDGVKINPHQLTSIYDLVEEAANRLQINPPEVFIKYDPTYNAYTLGSNEDHIIVLHSSLVEDFTQEELLFIIGHEMGHIKSRHVTYQTIGRFLHEGLAAFVNPSFSPLKVALDAWSREAEKTADRAGSLVTEHPVDSISALIMLALGSRKLLSEFNLQEYLLQEKELENFYGKLNLWFGGYNHPYIVTRVSELLTFMKSNAGINVKQRIDSQSPLSKSYKKLQNHKETFIVKSISTNTNDNKPIFCSNCGFEIEDVNTTECFICGGKIRRNETWGRFSCFKNEVKHGET